MGENNKRYTLNVIELELAVIIILLSVFLLKDFIINEDNKDNKDNKDNQSNQGNQSNQSNQGNNSW